MKKLSKQTILLINVVIALVGIILVFIGVIGNQPITSTLLEAIGTSLIATGGVNFMDRFLTPEEPIQGVRIIALKRGAVDPAIYTGKYRAEKIDIVGISLSECLREFVNDPAQKMINNILFHQARLRLLFLHPDSDFLKQRAIEDRIPENVLRERQRNSVELSILFFKTLRDRYEIEKSKGTLGPAIGEVDIKLIDRCPYFSMYRVDDDFYWGLYASYTTGIDSPLFLVTNEQHAELFNQLKKHFNHMLATDLCPSDNLLVNMGIAGPALNRDLAEKLLGPNALQMLGV